MSLEPSGRPRSSSPASSEASLPKPLSRHDEDVDGLKKDKTYRRYAANVDRALSLFDTALQEWADYISFLSRLLKALQTHPPNLHVVPNKTLVAKRLAQCLNPSLPSGVHQKALEVYAYVFGLLRTDGLARDLAIYLPGISPTLSFASLSVRPLFLSLFEKHVLQLNPTALRSAVKSIILALLPGLEDETSEDFEETLKLVDKLRRASSTAGDSSGAAAGDQYFWQCLFLASVTNPSRRVGALAYLNRHLPKLGGILPFQGISEEGLDGENGGSKTYDLSGAIESITSPEPGLLIRCFATGLADEQVLIQRNFLDLLVTHLPLHSPVLQKRITSGDLQLLVGAASGVVIRRDMSLNRRLWAWLLGPDFDKSSQVDDTVGQNNAVPPTPGAIANLNNDASKSQYFERFGLKPLVGSIKSMLANDSANPVERARPYRISLSLMDRWEVGGLVVPEVFLAVIRSAQRYKQTATSKAHFDEVFRSASAFFDGVESNLIFSEIVGLILSSRSGTTRPNRLIEEMRLTMFMLSYFNMKEEEMLTIHLPLLILSLLLKTKTLSASSAWNEPGYSSVANAALDEINTIINLLLRLVPERAFIPPSDKGEGLGSDTQASFTNENQVTASILGFYSRSKGMLRLPKPPFSASEVASLILREAQSLALLGLESESQGRFLRERMNLLVALLNKTQQAQTPQLIHLYEAIKRKVVTANDEHAILPMTITNTIVHTLTSLYSTKKIGYYISYEQMGDLIPALVHQLWEFLEPANIRSHVEAAICIWLLHSVSWKDHLVEAAITSLMVSSTKSSHQPSLVQAEKFFVFWNHSHHSNTDSFSLRIPHGDSPQIKTVFRAALLSQPLLKLLDLLSFGTGDSHVVKEWLRDLPSIYELFRIMLLKFQGFKILHEKLADETSEYREMMILHEANQCIYMLRLVVNVITVLSPSAWSLLLSNAAAQPARNKSVPFDVEEDKGILTIQNEISQICFHALHSVHNVPESLEVQQGQLRREALSLLRLLLSSAGADKLLSLDIDSYLLDHLSFALDEGKTEHQASIIDALIPVLKMRHTHHLSEISAIMAQRHQRKGSFELARMSVTEKPDKERETPVLPQPPPKLLDCLLKGISSTSTRPILDKWVNFLSECLPIYTTSIFKVLLKLVECFCKEITTSFNDLQGVFQSTSGESPECSPEHTTIALLSGFETCIAAAHDRLQVEEVNTANIKTPDQPQGFFGNIFATDSNQARPTSGSNTRLTVLLCFQDAVQLCYTIWAWGSSGRSKTSRNHESVASFQYTSLRMRNRARRILEHLFAAEALECLETLIQLWRTSIALDEPAKSRAIFSLLHTLDGSKPKTTIPAIFNAIYSRTNPAALDPSRKSAMASELSEADLAAFLVMYAKSLDDDFLDEIWGDCITFLRDVLTNPFPHRQILPRLLEFAVVLGGKMENTTFGDDRRARKELGDLILRLLPAIFTSKPLLGTHESSASSKNGQEYDQPSSSSLLQRIGPDDIIGILAVNLPVLTATLGEPDRISSAISSISTSAISPLFHARLFPGNVEKSTLDLLQQIAKVQGAAKIWKKDVGDAFNDSRFFESKLGLVKSHWIRLLRQWVLADTERLGELLSRLTPPTSAGLMFGVGASAARLEADRKAQLNLRRIALLIVASDEDHFGAELSELQQKLEDLLAATHISSPSSVTRAEIYMVFRSLVLKTGSTSLAPFWPMINTELQSAISAIPPDHESETYNPYSLLQASKLLETLLLMAPDDFQLQEWLFVTDTIDVVYPPNRWESVAIADELSRSLGKSQSSNSGQIAFAREANGYEDGDGENTGTSSGVRSGLKKAWLTSDLSRETTKDEIIETLLRPFFDRLSIHSFETTYSMGAPDIAAYTDDLLADLFNEFTIVS